jgi:hypothetical protein
MLDKSKILAMIKAMGRGENPKQGSVLERWMTVPDTPLQRSILNRIERRFAGQPNPTDDEIIMAIESYASASRPFKKLAA